MMSKESKTAASSTPKKKNNKKGEANDLITKFRGDGVSFKAKLYGTVDVKEARGDVMCQKAIQSLKSELKNASNHKQKILVRIDINGATLIDAASNKTLASHKVNRISFISKDPSDSRSFSYVVGNDEGRHVLYGIKTDKPAEAVLLTFKDLFQAVVQLQQMEGSKEQTSRSPSVSEEAGCRISASSEGARAEPLPMNIPVDRSSFSPGIEKDTSSPTDNIAACDDCMDNSNVFQIAPSMAGMLNEVAPSDNATSKQEAVLQSQPVTSLSAADTITDCKPSNAHPFSVAAIHQTNIAAGVQSTISPPAVVEPRDAETRSSTGLRLESPAASVSRTNSTVSDVSAALAEGDNSLIGASHQIDVSENLPSASSDNKLFLDNLHTTNIPEVDNVQPTSGADPKSAALADGPEKSKIDNGVQFSFSSPSVSIASDATNPWGATTTDVDSNSMDPWANFGNSATGVTEGASTDPWAGPTNTAATTDPFASTSTAISFDSDPFSDLNAKTSLTSPQDSQFPMSSPTIAADPFESSDPFQLSDPFLTTDPFISSDPFQSFATPDVFGDSTSPEQKSGVFGDGTSTEQRSGVFGDSTSIEQKSDMFGDSTSPKQKSEASGVSTSTEQTSDVFGDSTSTEQTSDVFGDSTSTEQTSDVFGDSTSTEQKSDLFCDSAATRLNQKTGKNAFHDNIDNTAVVGETESSESGVHHTSTNPSTVFTAPSCSADTSSSTSSTSSADLVTVRQEFQSMDASYSSSTGFAPPDCPAPTLPPEVLAAIGVGNVPLASPISDEKKSAPPPIPARKTAPPVPVRKKTTSS